MRADALDARVLQSLLSLQAAQKFKLFGRASMFDVMAGWRQTVHDSNPDVAVSFAASPGRTEVLANPGYARGSFVAGLGVRASVSRRATLGLGYDYETAAARARHTLAMDLRWIW